MTTFGSADMRSLEVTCLVWSEIQLTSNVNSTAQSVQKSMHEQFLNVEMNIIPRFLYRWNGTVIVLGRASPLHTHLVFQKDISGKIIFLCGHSKSVQTGIVCFIKLDNSRLYALFGKLSQLNHGTWDYEYELVLNSYQRSRYLAGHLGQ